MIAENQLKICQSCKSHFVIEPEDAAFHEKMEVPAPRLCPMCRLRRRLSFRNERTFSKRECDLCAKGVISMYSADVPFPVYCQPCWWGDAWTPPELQYDPARNFLDQFRELRDKTPHEATQAHQSTGSEYANFVANTKDAYLSSIILESRDIFYSRFLVKCADAIECEYAGKLERCVGVSYSADSFACKESRDIEGCQNVSFCGYSSDLSDCYGCINLKHQKYSIFNISYSKEEYFERLRELQALPLKAQKKQAGEFWAKNPRRGSTVFQSANCSGSEIYYSNNCKQSVLLNYVKDGAYLFEASSSNRNSETTQDLRDCSIVVDYQSSYEVIGGSRSSKCLFGFLNDDCLNCRYSTFLYGCSNAFGCVGLRNKKYRILNKEYSKEKYEQIVRNIAASMGEYGEFFPSELSPFAYNETLAQECMPLAKETALAQGWRWKDSEQRSYEITLPAAALPGIEEASEALLSEVIGCSHANDCEHQCTTAFKIAPRELAILKQVQAPLPALCPNCRRAERAPKHLFSLWERRCQCAGRTSKNGVYKNVAAHSHSSQPCSNEFSSSYDPNGSEIVYCEQCYQAEVA